MPKTVEVGRTGFVWDGTEHRFLSGEVHPWRLDPADWPTVLDAVAGLGFQAVSLYVPWFVHETGPGRFDFTGARDVEWFLALVHERGMKAMVRIGPDAGGELETSGWPRRILDDPACQALRPNGLPYLLVTATGHCFPPSYASRTVLREVERWYDEVVPRLARWQHPDGPVVACQVDNELGYHFQAHTYALDYHPDAVEGFRQFVGDPTAEPPRDGADEGVLESRKLDWVRWKEHHLRATLATLADWARAKGMDRVPIVHNDYPRLTSPQDLGALEASGAVDLAMADIYTTRHGGRFVRDLVRHLCGSSRLPFLAELGAGWLTLPWLLPTASIPYDEEVVSLRAMLGGARAANVYMLVERDRWYGSPLSRKGERREPKASFYPRLHDVLDRLRLEELERVAPVLLVENRDEGRRVAARQTLGGIVPCFNQVMPLDPRVTEVPSPDTDTLRTWEKGLGDVVDAAGLDCDHASSAALPDLSRYEVVLMPVLDRSHDDGMLDGLRVAAGRGVKVAVGPAPVDGLTGLASPLDAARLLPSPVVGRDDERVDLTVWRNDDRLVVVAANSCDEDVTVTLRFEPGRAAKLEGLWRDEVVGVDSAGTATVTLAPFEVQVWEATR
ncbi:MAG: beta-galactosidase [Acidimicrobiaceae bacterium]|nr:beta-galactosidase [Acidimicrobiaceae bacterium]